MIDRYVIYMTYNRAQAVVDRRAAEPGWTAREDPLPNAAEMLRRIEELVFSPDGFNDPFCFAGLRVQVEHLDGNTEQPQMGTSIPEQHKPR